jgi:hypothetical protein
MRFLNFPIPTIPYDSMAKQSVVGFWRENMEEKSNKSG